jgi:hypothetical protein
LLRIGYVLHHCRLGELRGLSLCLPWRRVTGLQPDQVRLTRCDAQLLLLRLQSSLLHPCGAWIRLLSYAALMSSLQVGTAERVALRLMMQAEAVRRSMVLAGAQYRTFFSWLLIVLRRWAAAWRACHAYHQALLQQWA